MLILAAQSQPDEGFGKLVGLLVAVAIAWAATELHGRYRQRQEQKALGSSPTPPRGAAGALSAAVPEDDDTDETSSDDEDGTNRFGLRRITLSDGSTLVQRAQAIWRTGSSDLPDDDPEEPEEEDEDPGETRQECADRLVRTKCRYSDAVAFLMNSYDISERSAKRDIAAAQKRLR